MFSSANLNGKSPAAGALAEADLNSLLESSEPSGESELSDICGEKEKKHLYVSLLIHLRHPLLQPLQRRLGSYRVGKAKKFLTFFKLF